MRISELEQIIKETFSEEKGVVRSVETIYESIEQGYRLIIAIHGLLWEDTSVIHTKFIFKTNKEKTELIENSFNYLFDINCVYHKVEFTNDLKQKIQDILNTNNFGQDIDILSDFINSSAMFLNHYMRKSNITDYSVFDVEYDPRFKNTPCDETTFNFKININDNYFIDLSIRKEELEDQVVYKFKFQFMDETDIIETDTLKNVHFTIGSNIARILDKKLKNK
jgi:hypothetical protein